MKMLLALLIYGLSILLLYTLVMTGRYGRRLRSKPGSTTVHRPLDILVQVHRRWVKRSFLVVIASILAIEPTFRILHLPYIGFFWYVHLPLLASFVFFSSFAYWLNGTKRNPSYPRRHNRLGRLAVFCGIMTALTGDVIVEILIWPRL
jgi:hypothetical protein